MNYPKVSLIVPVWMNNDNLYQMTVDCLYQMQQTNYPNYEIIAVDDCSPYDKLIDLIKQFPDIYFLRTPENGGSTVAVNYGIKYASGEFIQYQNNDTLFPDPNWLTEQMKLFKDPEVGIVGCKMRYADGRIQHAGACWRDINDHCIDHIGQYEDDIQYLEDVPFVTGCGMTVRKEILEKNGGEFTVFKGYGWDDLDIEVKAKKWGYKIKVAPKAEFIHLGTVSYKQRPELASNENYRENMKGFNNIEIKEEETIHYFKNNYYLL